MTTRDTPAAREGSDAAPATPDEIWAILRETAREQQETARLQRENERLQRENERRQQETDQLQRDNARYIRETAHQMRETDRRLKRAEHLFTTQWGKLMESLVAGDLVALLNERGIAVEGISQRIRKRRNGRHCEIDILALNGEETVAVEVKTTLRPNDVKRFLAKLSEFNEWFPEYRERRLYGAMAYLEADDSATRNAARMGLFVIRATGSSASIVNRPDFRPRIFSGPPPG